MRTAKKCEPLSANTWRQVTFKGLAAASPHYLATYPSTLFIITPTLNPHHSLKQYTSHSTPLLTHIHTK